MAGYQQRSEFQLPGYFGANAQRPGQTQGNAMARAERYRTAGVAEYTRLMAERATQMESAASAQMEEYIETSAESVILEMVKNPDTLFKVYSLRKALTPPEMKTLYAAYSALPENSKPFMLILMMCVSMAPADEAFAEAAYGAIVNILQNTQASYFSTLGRHTTRNIVIAGGDAPKRGRRGGQEGKRSASSTAKRVPKTPAKNVPKSAGKNKKPSERSK